MLKKISQKNIETTFGEMNLILYTDLLSSNTHIALVKGEIKEDDDVLVRVHEPLSIFDFIEKENNHSWPPLKALDLIKNEEKGVIIFLNYQESQLMMQKLIN